MLFNCCNRQTANRLNRHRRRARRKGRQAGSDLNLPRRRSAGYRVFCRKDFGCRGYCRNSAAGTAGTFCTAGPVRSLKIPCNLFPDYCVRRRKEFPEWGKEYS